MRRKRICLTALALLTAAVCLLGPAVSGAAAVDLSKSCSITVHPDDGNFDGDIEKADVVLDLYRVADAEKTPGYDSCSYTFTGVCSELSLSAEPSTAEWRKLSDEAANLLLGPESDAEPVRRGIKAGEQCPGLETGLYLLVARGNGLEDYTVRIQTDDGEKIATRAQSADYTYTFLPELVSLPTKEAEEGGAPNTANPGEWQYDPEVTLKPEQNRRYGSLEIVKTLRSYETKEPAMFVFEIEAVLDGEVVFSDVESIIFTAAGTERIQITDRIPVGAQVTVREVYSGAAYRLETPEAQEAVIAADTIAAVEFTNDYGGDQKGGHGIRNHFSYSEESGRWSWTADGGAAGQGGEE